MSDNISNPERKRLPSFIEPRSPLITNPFMRRRPEKGINLMDLYGEEPTCDEPELVQVYLRLKPCNRPSNLYQVRGDRNLIISHDTATAGHGRKTNLSKIYTFSHIFPENTSQNEIFDHVVKDNLTKLADGRSFTLLTYGASGSGKTYTLMGTVASPGLVPRSLEYLFNNLEVQTQPVYKPAERGFDTLSYSAQEKELLFVKRLRKLAGTSRYKYRKMSSQLTDLIGSLLYYSKSKHYIWVSFIEIYNEGIYDLLAGSHCREARLQIREDSNGNVYVKGAIQAFVRSGQEAYDVMVAGKHNLQVAATGVHERSSRSHCIFTITMLTENDGGSIVTSCVRLCDLAGSERARRTRNTGARMKESRAINTSLHVLERCLHSLRRKQAVANRDVVPYRESKLTRLLGAGLSGTRGESVTMVVTLNPSAEYAHESRHVLQLAAVANDLQINNTSSDSTSSLQSSSSHSSFESSSHSSHESSSHSSHESSSHSSHESSSHSSHESSSHSSHESSSHSSHDSSSHDLNKSERAELVKLRTSNERLRCELLQCQNYNKELKAALIDEKRELDNLAKESSRQLYEPHIEELTREIEELKEKYERQMAMGLKEFKIDQLTTEIATLKKKLTAEQLARARAEEEIQHLRACIEERDGNDEVSTDDNASMTESDSEEEQYELCNESLEPTFRKEDIKRTRLLRKSLEMDNVSDLDDTLEDDILDSSDDTCIMNTCKKNISHVNEEREKSQESSMNKTIPRFPSLDKDNINEESGTDNIVDLSHDDEETANDSKKETIVVEID